MILYHNLEEIMILTQQGGFIIKPIAKLLGIILNAIYELMSNMGIASIGASIINTIMSASFLD